MFYGMSNLAFIGLGGGEILVVMLVLLMMFGAKDAPRMLRKWNKVINQIRNTADGFKREIMYGDLTSENPAYTPPSDDHDNDAAYGETYDDGHYGYGEPEGQEAEIDGSQETSSGEEPLKSKADEENGDVEKT